ncbi:MAG TPA: helix-turn-helix transcriptional regulator, partial [Longimicrobiales bacterium]|nr:helix-turn-helix transcriptional regulator [Longimicrobiales bacterium]
QVLLAVLRLGADAYSVSIVLELEERTGREVAPAAVYIALRRLEDHGLARSELRSPCGSGSDGRERRYFEPTPDGLDLMARSRRRFVSLWDGIESVLEGRSG